MVPVVASVPAGHVYVRHLADPDGKDDVIRLKDLSPREPAAEQPWWPPSMPDSTWVAGAQTSFDLMHIHFGFGARSLQDVRDLVEAPRHVGRPWVMTVHDLRNPHQLDAARHDAQLDVLVRAAAEVITLTAGAAEEIKTRWGRDAHVLPHPQVVDGEWLALPRAPSDDFAVGVQAKSLRASTTVLVPDCGFDREQRPCLAYQRRENGTPDAPAIREVVVLAHAERPVWRADPNERTGERRWLTGEHLRIYLAALAGR